MHTRREFIRNAAALTGTAFVWGSVPEAIARAMSIDPEQGTTWKDAEHVVILMQENRSFDHCYGSLRGVRGFRDPHPHRQPNGRPVWFQTNAAGETHAPFRLDMKGSNSTWIGGLPHSWGDQVDARNGGGYDKWLIAKARKDLPLTMGHYTREDLPFYYLLADAFTICDQAFCSSLTGTTPNRLYLWTGTIRKDSKDPARVTNGDTDYGAEAAWKTYPERLEDAGISWRIYQNEISLDSGFSSEEDNWLSNFTDNPIEWFTQYNVRFSKSRRAYVAHLIRSLPARIDENSKAASAEGLGADDKARLERDIAKLEEELEAARKEREAYNDETWAALPAKARALHEKAFTTSASDPKYRSLTELAYKDGDQERRLKVPAGDVLHRFRQDVATGKLPAVSWIVAPEAFSDHPGSAWFGAWYVSEVMNILTKDPEVWKKTIFILCYDENDGYFDHVPPFVAPHPGRPETGKVSLGIDTSADVSNNHGRDHSIGLGFRCPLVVASPWSRGGSVNSEVFDHTSILQFLETWLAAKGKSVKETNISDWRRTVCGDLTSVFKPYLGESYELLKALDRDETIIGIHKARFKSPMKGAAPLSDEEIASLQVGSAQEPGTRQSCPLPYELEVNALLNGDHLEVVMEARNKRFGSEASGAPFNASIYGSEMSLRSYAVRAGDKLNDWFEASTSYHVKVDGPNGFMREFRGTPGGPNLRIVAEAKGSDMQVRIETGESGLPAVVVGNAPIASVPVEIRDHAYGAKPKHLTVGRTGNTEAIVTTEATVSTKASHGWYDFSVIAEGLEYRYAGRVETGKWSVSDPAMG